MPKTLEGAVNKAAAASTTGGSKIKGYAITRQNTKLLRLMTDRCLGIAVH